jgi:E3 ubiquitin-protein ligase HACE1
MAIYHGELLDIHFTRSFYKHILGLKVIFEDIESLDPQYYKNLKWLLDNNIEDLGLDLTFTSDLDLFGKTETVELKPGGLSIGVTDENKFDYVQLVTELQTTTQIQQQIQSFLKVCNTR